MCTEHGRRGPLPRPARQCGHTAASNRNRFADRGAAVIDYIACSGARVPDQPRQAPDAISLQNVPLESGQYQFRLSAITRGCQ
jgi:hypothetical protein